MSVDAALHQSQLEQGAEFDAQSASDLPIHFGDARQEFLAGCEGAVLFDLSGRTHIQVTGADRQKFVHSFCTNEVRSLKPGQSCEAFVTTIQGKVLGHVFVFAEDKSLWIDSVPGSEDRLLKHLDKYLMSEDVQFLPRSADDTEFYITGPASIERLDGLGLPARELKLHRHACGTLAGVAVSLRRVDWFRQPGFLIQVPTVQAAPVWLAIVQGQIKAAGSQAFEGLRIRALFPTYGIDITEENLAQEVARTDVAISFTKGCYLGQEPIARIDSMGHVNQELRGLRFSSGPVPERQAKVLMPGEVREAGVITSAAWDHLQNAPVAFALLKRNYMSAGRELSVVTKDGEFPAIVYDHKAD